MPGPNAGWVPDPSNADAVDTDPVGEDLGTADTDRCPPPADGLYYSEDEAVPETRRDGGAQ